MFENICLNCFKDRRGFDVCPHCGFVNGTPPEQEYHLHPGTVLQGRYLVGTVVGFGGFGITYKAWDTKLGSIVAIKEFYPAGLVNRIPGDTEVQVFDGKDQSNFRESLDRFLDEAKSLAQFNGKANIVNVFGYFEENNTAYYVMEYLDGISLKDYIEQNGKMTIDVATAIICDLLNGIGEVHKKGILHRDIAPDNIIITNEGVGKILDFGSARFSAEHSEETMSAFIKPGYAAPEQYASKGKQGVWTDIYGLGATMYYIVTGVKPEESTDRLIEDKVKRPSELGIELPVEIDKSIMKAIALQIELRFKTADEFLAAVQGDYEIEYPDVEIKKRKRKRSILAGVSAACFVAAIIFTIFIYKQLQVELYETIENGTELTVWTYVENKSFDPGMSYLPESFKEKVVENKSGQYDKQKAAYDDMINAYRKFMQDTYKVDINVDLLVFDSKETYETSLKQAVENDTLPDIFFVGDLYDELADKCLDLSEFKSIFAGGKLKFINEENYELLYPQMKLIPLSFNTPVLYVNESLISDYNVSQDVNYEHFDSLDEIKALDVYAGIDKATSISRGKTLKSRSFGIDESGFDEFVALYGDTLADSHSNITITEPNTEVINYLKDTYKLNSFNPTVPISQYFYLNQLACMVGDTSVFEYVNSYLGGSYKVEPLTNNGKTVVSLCSEVALNANMDENTELAARSLVEYLLTDSGQQYINTVIGTALPIYSDTLDEYIETVNKNLSCLNNLDSGEITIIAENKYIDSKIGRQLYNECYLGGGEVSENTELKENDNTVPEAENAESGNTVVSETETAAATR